MNRPPGSVIIRYKYAEIAVLGSGRDLVAFVFDHKIPIQPVNSYPLFAYKCGSKTGRIRLCPNPVAIPFPQAEPRFRIPFLVEPKAANGLALRLFWLGWFRLRISQIAPHQTQDSNDAESFEIPEFFLNPTHSPKRYIPSTSPQDARDLAKHLATEATTCPGAVRRSG